MERWQSATEALAAVQDLKARDERSAAAFALTLTCDKSTFDEALVATWALLDTTPVTQVASEVVPMPSTIDSENRVRDAARVMERLLLVHPEHGCDSAAQLFVGDLHVASGYLRVLYGDHGPYFELAASHVHWGLFTEHVLKGPARHYHEHYVRRTSASDVEAKLYGQFSGVGDEPNPPPGDFSVANNRREGYAQYRGGVLYLSADAVTHVRRCPGH